MAKNLQRSHQIACNEHLLFAGWNLAVGPNGKTQFRNFELCIAALFSGTSLVVLEKWPVDGATPKSCSIFSV